MAQWRVFANECVLTNQAQDVHCISGHCAEKEVGVKLAAGQLLQIHFSLEIGMKSLVRHLKQPLKRMYDKVFLQTNDILHGELLQQCRRPAFPLIVLVA